VNELSSVNENVEKSIKSQSDKSNLEWEIKCDMNEIIRDGLIRRESESDLDGNEIRIASENERKMTKKSKLQIPSKSPQRIYFAIEDSRKSTLSSLDINSLNTLTNSDIEVIHLVINSGVIVKRERLRSSKRIFSSISSGITLLLI
jgi:hypothetical protein